MNLFGKSFHAYGPAIEKALSAMCSRVQRTLKLPHVLYRSQMSSYRLHNCVKYCGYFARSSLSPTLKMLWNFSIGTVGVIIVLPMISNYTVGMLTRLGLSESRKFFWSTRKIFLVNEKARRPISTRCRSKTLPVI